MEERVDIREGDPQLFKHIIHQPEAYAFIYDSISYGFKLESYIQQIPLEQGQVTMYLPKDINHNSIMNFHDDILDKHPSRSEPEYQTEAEVIQYIRGGKNRYGIFEDAVMQTNFSFAFSYNNQTMAYQGKIYYLIQSANSDEEIRNIMEGSVNFRAVGVCFESDYPLTIVHGAEIPEAWFSMAVNNISMLLIGIFDERSWLIWEPFSTKS